MSILLCRHVAVYFLGRKVMLVMIYLSHSLRVTFHKTNNDSWPLLSFKRDQRAQLGPFFPLQWHKCWPGRIPARPARNHQGSNVQLCTPFVVFHWAKLEWKVKARQRVSTSLWYHCPKMYWLITQISAKTHIQHHNSSQHEIFHSVLAFSTSNSPFKRLPLYHNMNTHISKTKAKAFLN